MRMPPIRLIVNADDLGNGTTTDRAIFKAFIDGIVSSASLLVTGSSWQEAARQATALGLPLGIHLDLSEGVAASGAIAGLTDAVGRFPGKAATRQALAAGTVPPATIAAEFLAQIERARAAGISPDHLDTHQHCALFPAATDALCQTLQTTGINRLRLPQPREPVAADPPELRAELNLYRRLAPRFITTVRDAGGVTPQGLYGMQLLNRLDTAQLRALLQTLPKGDWELMVHPGYCNSEHPFATAERETELSALTSPSVRTLLAARSIALIDFSELPCAC